MEFGEIKELVRRKAETKWDEYHPVDQMIFYSLDALRIRNTLFKITRSAKKLIGQRLGIPLPYLERCPPALQAVNLNHRLQELGPSAELFCRFEGSSLRAVFTKRYRPIDNNDILQQLDVPDNAECLFRIDPWAPGWRWQALE